MPRRAFEPIYPNPYIAGNPIRNQEMFFGRVDEFRFIARALEDGRKTALIVLFGERRSGKSSILYQILNGRLGEAFLPIFVDMQIMAGIAGDADFFERIIADACKQLAGNGLSAEPYATQFKEAAATNVFRRFLQEVKSRFPERAPLLLVDEYENLEARVKEGSLSQHILTFFAGLLETDLVSFVFTGSKSLEVHDQAIWGEELFRKATSRKISFLTKDDTTRLITQPLQNKVDFAPEVVAQIYTITAGQPFYTQMICQNLVYHLNEVQKRNVTLEDLQAVVDGVLENPPPQLIFNWSEHSSERKLALSLLAEFSEGPQAFLSARDLCQGIKRKKLELDLAPNFFHAELSSLFQDEYVLQKARKYGFRLDLYRLWVRRDHNIWQVKKEIGTREIARITKQRHVQKEKKKRAIRILERVGEIALVVLAIYVSFRLFFEKQRPVLVQANGGPFEIWVDKSKYGTTKGRLDSTRFEIATRFKILEGLTRGKDYAFKVKLLSYDEVWTDSVTIKNDSNVVDVRFSSYPVKVITDAASAEMQLGGDSTQIKANKPEARWHEFNVCAGTYLLRVEDPSTGEVKDSVITVPVDSNFIKIDFDNVVLLTLAANHYPFGYAYKWRNSQGKTGNNSGLADSIRVLQGRPKGEYEFTFTNPRTKENNSVKALVRSDTMISVKFDPKWKLPATKPPDPPIQPKSLKKYTLRIESVPDSARVILNGKDRGFTTFVDSLEARDYSIILVKAGYDTFDEEVKLDRNTIVGPIKLEPQYGYLKLVVQDKRGGRALSNVEVFIDGEPEGIMSSHAKVFDRLLKNVWHKLRLERSSYFSIDTSFIITKIDTVNLQLQMVKQ